MGMFDQKGDYRDDTATFKLMLIFLGTIIGLGIFGGLLTITGIVSYDKMLEVKEWVDKTIPVVMWTVIVMFTLFIFYTMLGKK